MNYTVIVHEPTLVQFINWLPDNEAHEQYYMSLFARKKYYPHLKWIKSDKSQLARKTSTKQKLLSKIRQLECPIGAYVQHQDNAAIPPEALALYINPNPRDLYKATLHGLSDFAKLIETQAKNYNPHQEILSTIQRTSSRKVWIDFDIDCLDDSVLPKIHSILGDNKACRRILRTRGGYHVLVKPDMVPDSVARTWYKNLASMADVKGDNMIPVPGCIQGYIDGEPFYPRFVD